MHRCHPALRLPTLAAWTVVALLALAACDGGEAAALRSTNAELNARLADAERAGDVMRARIADLEAEVDDLRTTEEMLWATAVAHREAGAADEAEAALERLVARFPDGARRAEADAMRALLDADRAQRLVGEARWYLDNGQVNNARVLFQRVLEHYGSTPSAAGARTGLAAVEERAAQQAAIDAGFQIEGVETFWRTNADVLGGTALIQPEIRFHVRPASDRPVEYLQIRAVFFSDSDGVLEEFGSATEYLVGSGDLPLEPGVRKQARMRSSVGYRYNGLLELRFAGGNAPDMRVDLHFKTSFTGQWQRFYSGPVAKTYQY